MAWSIAACAAVFAGAASAATAAPPLLTDQQLIDYDKSPLGPVTEPRSFVIGTWGGFPVQVEVGCSSTCPSGAWRMIYLSGIEMDSCTDVGAVLEDRPRPGNQNWQCVPKPIWFDAQLASQPSFSDQSLKDFMASPIDAAHWPESDSVVGSYRGALVRIEIRCGFDCSMSKYRVLYLETPSGKTCEQVGGVTRKLSFYGDFADTSLTLCVPSILDEK